MMNNSSDVPMSLSEVLASLGQSHSMLQPDPGYENGYNEVNYNSNGNNNINMNTNTNISNISNNMNNMANNININMHEYGNNGNYGNFGNNPAAISNHTNTMVNNYGCGTNDDQLSWARTVLLNHQRDMSMVMPMATPNLTSGRKHIGYDESMSVNSSSSGKKKLGESFPEKLHRVLEDAENEGNAHIIGFFAQGRAFAVHDPDTFVRSIMPRYFTTSRFSSFQRQLNLYGFRRIVERSMSGFCHEHFLQGQKEITYRITRKKQRVPGGSEDDAATARRLEERMNAKGDEYSVISFGSTSLGSASTSASATRMSIADARQQMANVRSMLAGSHQQGQAMPPPAPRQPEISQVPMGGFSPTPAPSTNLTDAHNHLQDMRALLQLQMQMGTLK